MRRRTPIGVKCELLIMSYGLTELSDDSFAWSDASDSDESNTSTVKMDGCYESESNIKIKEKSYEKQKRSKKRKYEDSTEVDGVENCSQKTIKSEVESDLDISRMKKKNKYSENSYNQTPDSLDPAEYYLNYRVKLEQESFVEPDQERPKKKRKHSTKSEIKVDNDVDISSQINNEENVDYTEEVNEKDIVKEKAKKRRKSQMFLSNEFVNSDDDDFQEEKPKRKKHKKDKSSNHNSEVSQNEISCINSSTLNNHIIEDNSEIINNNEENNVSKEPQEQENCQFTISDKRDKKHKLLDNLRFEDEDSVDYDSKNDTINSTMSNVKKFTKAKKNLSLINLSDQTNFLTEDDDIWIVKGPHDLDINNFKDKTIKLDTKGKLKFNRQIYDTVIDSDVQKAPIMLYDKKKSYIKNVAIRGVINIRNRIPKIHIPDENVIFNNQPNFIPLPETKFRHPLFGINYKKAMKIPSSVAQRLNDSATKSTIIDNGIEKNKKHRKQKTKVEVESETELKPFELETPVISFKKKKKKKEKRIKKEPDSADAWESEKTIEKNLFNF